MSKIKISEDVERSLETIARHAGENVKPDEMVAALIHHAYNLPHGEWEKILQAYRSEKHG